MTTVTFECTQSQFPVETNLPRQWSGCYIEFRRSCQGPRGWLENVAIVIPPFIESREWSLFICVSTTHAVWDADQTPKCLKGNMSVFAAFSGFTVKQINRSRIFSTSLHTTSKCIILFHFFPLPLMKTFRDVKPINASLHNMLERIYVNIMFTVKLKYVSVVMLKWMKNYSQRTNTQMGCIQCWLLWLLAWSDIFATHCP